MKRLPDKQHLLLSYLYQLRVLSYYEVQEYIFTDMTDAYITKVLTALVRDDYICKGGFRKDTAYYQINQKGIVYLKQYGVIKVGSRNTEVDCSMLPANKVKISERSVKHQIALNHFVLRRDEERYFDYYDEKYIASFLTGARPDGIIVDEKLYFLEMDMNTESEKALRKKWQHYRNFILSKSFYDLDQDILVMFILGGGVKDSSKRRSYLRKQLLFEFPEKINNHLNFVIGTEDKLFNILQNKTKAYINKYFKDRGYKIYPGRFGDKLEFNYFDFDFYLYKMDYNGKAKMLNGEPEDYIIDDLTDGNLYSLRKIKHVATIEAQFKFKYNRYIKWIEVVDSENEALRICKDLDIYSDCIYFTTLHRLYNKPLHAALFQMDRDGIRWHFSDEGLRIKDYE